MRVNKWTLGLAALGLVSLSPAVLAQNAPQQTPLLTQLSATTISGYVDTSAIWNPGTGNANPAPYAFDTSNKRDGFNVDQIDIKISKAQDETGWSAGYTAELSYGPDAMAIDGGAYPIRQAFVALHMPVGNGIDWQLGRWDNIIGYESSDSYKDPNFTRSYGYTFEPTEHTGLLGTYKVNDALSVQAGVADTLTTEPTFINQRAGDANLPVESKKAVVTLVTLTAPTSWGFMGGSTLALGFDHGQGAYTHDKTEWYAGLNLNTPIKALTLGASYDAVDHFDGDVLGVDTDLGSMNAVAGYLSYAATEKLTFNGRAEWAWGDLGALSGTPDFLTGDGFNKVLALTGTVQYNLWANVISRLEVRWDHAADGSTPFGGTFVTGIPDKKNDILVAANVIYKF